MSPAAWWLFYNAATRVVTKTKTKFSVLFMSDQILRCFKLTYLTSNKPSDIMLAVFPAKSPLLSNENPTTTNLVLRYVYVYVFGLPY